VVICGIKRGGGIKSLGTEMKGKKRRSFLLTIEEEVRPPGKKGGKRAQSFFSCAVSAKKRRGEIPIALTS